MTSIDAVERFISLQMRYNNDISSFQPESLFERPTTSEANPKISNKLDSFSVVTLDDATYYIHKGASYLYIN